MTLTLEFGTDSLSVGDYCYVLSKNLEDRSSHFLCGGSLRLLIFTCAAVIITKVHEKINLCHCIR